MSFTRTHDDRSTVAVHRPDGPRDHLLPHQRTHGVVNQHDSGSASNAFNPFQTLSWRLAPPATTDQAVRSRMRIMSSTTLRRWTGAVTTTI